MDPELCRKIFEDWVERPYIPLYHMLRYEMYEVCLWLLKYNGGIPNTLDQVRTWLKEVDTFRQFQRTVTDMVHRHHLNINLKAINEDDWMTHIPSNDVIVLHKYEWLRGGTIELKYDWLRVEKPHPLYRWLMGETLELAFGLVQS